jgi:hypothetical protein
VSGSEDAFVTPDDARRLTERAGAAATGWLIPAAGHPGSEREPFAARPDEYRARVLQLVEAALPPSVPASAAPTTGSSVT